METAKEKAIGIVRERGCLIRTSEAIEQGIHRRTLYGLRDEGILLQISRGLYQLSDLDTPAEVNLAEVSKKDSNGVVCLISALSFHELTTQIPHFIRLAVERKSRKPKIDYPPVNVCYFSGDMFSRGIEIHRIMGQNIRIYNAPKTVIDCFRWRKTVGLDVAIEAARDYLKRKNAAPSRLMEYAKISKIEKFVHPYLQALTAISGH